MIRWLKRFKIEKRDDLAAEVRSQVVYRIRFKEVSLRNTYEAVSTAISLRMTVPYITQDLALP